jgi:hypothetical protein
MSAVKDTPLNTSTQGINRVIGPPFRSRIDLNLRMKNEKKKMKEEDDCREQCNAPAPFSVISTFIFVGG